METEDSLVFTRTRHGCLPSLGLKTHSNIILRSMSRNHTYSLPFELAYQHFE